MYWRLDEELQQVELDYPRDVSSVWRGLPADGVDAAFRSGASTYFFRGRGYWRFDDRRMRVRHPAPAPIADHWMGCPPLGGAGRPNDNIRDPFRSGGGAAAAGAGPGPSSHHAAFTLLLMAFALAPQ